MHIVFLTRKYPPQKGGMETFSYELIRHFSDEKTVIARGKRQADIIWVIPLLAIKAIGLRKKADAYHLGDLVLAPVARILKVFTPRPVVATVHGLELTYKKMGPLYTWMINASLPSVDRFVCVSENTRSLLMERGVPEEKIKCIPHGVTPPQMRDRNEARSALCRMMSTDDGCDNQFIILSVGRLVRRKGIEWFVRSVMPLLDNLSPLFVIASDGPERESIERAIEETKLQQSVTLLGGIDNELLTNLYSGADAFVMPNIDEKDDVEGFGFVAVEAAAAGLPVVASRLEGITDAIYDGQNGRLVDAEQPEQFAAVLREWAADVEERRAFGQRAREYTVSHFRWDDVAESYRSVFDSLLKY
ncbi:MAG: glycosyltransferase family 4 protein [Candidatus Kerfeldbacteria bacterium]